MLDKQQIKLRLLNNSIEFGDLNNKTDKFSYRFDNRKVLLGKDNELIYSIAVKMWEQVKLIDPKVQVIVTKGIGGLPLLTAIKLAAYVEDQVNLHGIFIRDARKTYGKKQLFDGATQEDTENLKAVFIDDLIKTGKTFKQAKTLLLNNDYNLNIVGCVFLIDLYDPYGSRRISATEIPCVSLFRRHDFGFTRHDKDLTKIVSAVKWRLDYFHAGVSVMEWKSAPSIHKNYLLVGNDDNSRSCFNKNTGELVWKHTSSNPQPKGDCSVSLCVDDLVYWASYDGTLRCHKLNTGAQVWANKLDTNLHASPIIVDNTIVIGTEHTKFLIKYGGYGEGDVVCVDKDTGTEIWRTPTGGMIPCTAKYVKKYDCVIVGSNDFHVYILNAKTGKILSKIPTKGEVKGQPVVSLNQDIAICVSLQAVMYAIEIATGKVLWFKVLGFETLHCYPLIFEDKVVVSNRSNSILCVNIHTGAVDWANLTRQPIGWGLIDIKQKDCLLGITKTGQIHLFNKYTGLKISSDNLNKIIPDIVVMQPPVLEDNTLFVVSNNAGILALTLDLSNV